GYAAAEPYAYESALSVRWVILGQVTLMRTGFLWDTRIADVDYEKGVAPWVAWGPYLWANGTMPRSDGLTWERDDFASDGASLSAHALGIEPHLLDRPLRDLVHRGLVRHGQVVAVDLVVRVLLAERHPVEAVLDVHVRLRLLTVAEHRQPGRVGHQLADEVIDHAVRRERSEDV